MNEKLNIDWVGKVWKYSRYKLPKWLVDRFEEDEVCGFCKAPEPRNEVSDD